jgi:hypothetical protein
MRIIWGRSGVRYDIDAQRVTHERLNEEVLIINVVSGAYYSGSGSFADLWSLITQGASTEDAAAHLSETFGQSAEAILPGIRDSIGHLLGKGLIREAPEREAPEGWSLPDLPRSEWQAPSFAEYTDMWDLIQLDPVHEVGEAGWPFAPPEHRT